VTAPTESPDQQIARLTQELWVARDAAIGATAELGTARSRVRELEVRVDQLERELATTRAEMSSRAVKIAISIAKPFRRIRGVN
jgi:chromosome segregation ATPase